MNITYKKPVIADLNVRSVLIDVFKEAQHAGEASPGYNPALATKQPRRKVTWEQGINTKKLPDHENQQQTDKYHDDRGKNWIRVLI